MKALFFLGALVAFGDALPRIRSIDRGQTLIVGGVPAKQGEVPYQLSLRYDDQHHCGASIIEVQGVIIGLTAAHCTPDFVPPEDFKLVAGDLSLSDLTGIEQTRKVVRIVNHEDFDKYTYANDIALIFLDAPYDLNENVASIPLPDEGVDTTGDLVVSGWGRLSDQGQSPDALQIVEVPVVSDDDCREAYLELGDEIFDHFICAGYLGIGGKDACQGDSGGPARSADGNYLAGIVSWGEGCADPRYPGIYTEVTHFVKWINNQVSAYIAERKL